MVPLYLKRLGFFNELNGAAWLAGATWLVYTSGALILLQTFAVALAFGLFYRFVIRHGSHRIKPHANAAVLITGASTGIGAASARYFAARGFTVFATVRKAADGEALKASVPEAPARRNIVPVILDVTSADSITAAVETVAAEASRAGLALQSVINNAAYSQNCILELATDDLVDKQYRTNVNGVINVTNAFLPLLRAARGHTSVDPSVVFVSSVVGKGSMTASGLYTSSKHALESIAEVYNYELAALGINSVIVAPGCTDTPGLPKASSALVSTLADSSRQSHLDNSTAAHYKAVSDNVGRAFSSALLFPPEFVADTLFEAVTCANPHLRYRATPDAHVALGLFAILPDIGMTKMAEMFASSNPSKR